MTKQIEITFEEAKAMYESCIDSLKSKVLEEFPELEPKKWKRLNLNRKSENVYCFRGTTDNGLIISDINHPSINLTYTFKTKEEAINENKLHSLMIAMRNWAKFHNELDSFVPDWEDDMQSKYGIDYMTNKLEVDCTSRHNGFLFQINVSTKKRAEEMLDEFKDEIQEIIDLKLI